MNANKKLATKSKSTLPVALSLLSAGDHLEVSEDYDLLDINEMITKGREGFIAYVVTGDSMVDDIRPGYIVFVDSWAEPRNGDIIVSCVNDRNNVKVFERNHRGLFLVPKNGDHPVRQVRPTDNFHVLGVVKGHLALY